MAYWIKNILIVGLMFSHPVLAQDYSEQALKALFTSQQQRQDIDRDKKSSHFSEGEALIAPSSVQVNGIVKRSSGKSVVWVNGKNTMDNSMVDGVKVYSNSINAQNKVPVVIDGQKVYVKPGETWSEETGISGVGD